MLFVFSVFEETYQVSQRLKSWMTTISFVFLVIQVGLRWETGTDWVPYYDHFVAFRGFTSIIISDFEYGYGFFEFVISQFTLNYSVFLLVHAIIYYSLIFKSFKNYSHNLYLTLMMFYTLSMGVMGSNRQLIALAICIFAVKFIKEKKPIIFFVLVLIATSFHTTAYIFAIYYFLNKDIKPVRFILILGSAIIIGKTQIPLIIISRFSELIGGNLLYKTSVYTDGTKEVLAVSKLSIMGLMKRLSFLLLFYYNRTKLKDNLKYYTIMLNGYFVGIIFYFLFADTLLILVNRGSLYFTIMEPLLIASQILLLKRKDTKFVGLLILLMFSLIFFFQSISVYSDLFIPYKGIFINQDYHRLMY